jgi:hypothetical protein
MSSSGTSGAGPPVVGHGSHGPTGCSPATIACATGGGSAVSSRARRASTSSAFAPASVATNASCSTVQPPAGEQPDDLLHALADVHEHAIAAAQSERVQPRGQRFDPPLQLAVGDAPRAVDDRDVVELLAAVQRQQIGRRQRQRGADHGGPPAAFDGAGSAKRSP